MASTPSPSSCSHAPHPIPQAFLCLSCGKARRLPGKRLCASSACAQAFVRSCAFCRKKRPASGAGRFCSQDCRELHAKRIVTPKCLRPVCGYFVEGNFDQAACPHGASCWDYHPPSPQAVPPGASLAVVVPSSHVRRFIAYAESGPHVRFHVLGQSLKLPSHGQPTAGRKAHQVVLLKPLVHGDAATKIEAPSELWWRAVLALAEDVNLQLVILNFASVRLGSHRLVRDACNAMLHSILRSRGSTDGSRPRVRVHASPPELVPQTEAWFERHAPGVEVVKQDFDFVATIIMAGDSGSILCGVEPVPAQGLLCSDAAATSCHCTMSSSAACLADGGPPKLGAEYLRSAFLRKLWLNQERVDSQSHRFPSQLLASGSNDCGSESTHAERNVANDVPCTQRASLAKAVHPLVMPVRLCAAVSRAYWKLAEVLCTTDLWQWTVRSAEGLRGHAGKVIGLDLGASPGGWSYQVNTVGLCATS